MWLVARVDLAGESNCRRRIEWPALDAETPSGGDQIAQVCRVGNAHRRRAVTRGPRIAHRGEQPARGIAAAVRGASFHERTYPCPRLSSSLSPAICSTVRPAVSRCGSRSTDIPEI